MPLERTASVEDMVGNLWRLGRTPSQAEFEQFFSNIAQVGSQQNLAAAAQAAATANMGAEAGAEAAPGIPRVASIDLLRKMMMNHQPGMVAPVAPPPNMMPGMFPGATGMPNTAAAFGFGAPQFAPGMVPPAAMAAAMDPGASAPAPAAKPAAKKAPAKRKAPAKAPAKKDAKTRSVTPEGGTGSDLDDDEDGSEDGKGKTTDEVRRQRRMLSNRESARRSRRRKLEHVAVLDQQINGHKAENAALMERLREMEQRTESVIRENAGLKAEVERLTAALREAAAGGKGVERSSSLQRIASAGTLAAGPKATLGDGTASPAIGEDSPRGFVPFRSLQSYENLLSLQAQTR